MKRFYYLFVPKILKFHPAATAVLANISLQLPSGIIDHKCILLYSSFSWAIPLYSKQYSYDSSSASLSRQGSTRPLINIYQDKFNKGKEKKTERHVRPSSATYVHTYIRVLHLQLVADLKCTRQRITNSTDRHTDNR